MKTDSPSPFLIGKMVVSLTKEDTAIRKQDMTITPALLKMRKNNGHVLP